MMLTWKLPQLLDRENVSAYRLHKAVERHRISPTTVYRWAREMPATLDASVLEHIIAALRELTGKPVNVQDLLDYEE